MLNNSAELIYHFGHVKYSDNTKIVRSHFLDLHKNMLKREQISKLKN